MYGCYYLGRDIVMVLPFLYRESQWSPAV